jgi:conjugative transfer ATPase
MATSDSGLVGLGFLGLAPAKTGKADAIQHGRRRTDRPVTVEQVKKLYDRPPSFTNQLPWLEFDSEHQVVLLADGHSIGVAFDLRPVSTEARPEAWLLSLRDKIQVALSSAIPEHDDPWVLQLYVQDETRLDRLTAEIAAYAKPEAKESVFSKSWFGTLEAHLAEISRPGGLFVDKLVTGSPWQGKHRKVRGTLYRPRPKTLLEQGGQVRIEAILQESRDIVDRFSAGMESAGIKLTRLSGSAFHDWLFKWFNPRPETTDGDVDALLALAPYPDVGSENRPYGWDLSEQLMSTPPAADPDKGIWWFDHLPHRVMVVQSLKNPPVAGVITHERQGGDAKSFALFDQMPEHTIMALTMTVKPQDLIRSHLLNIERGSYGDYADAKLAAHDAREAQLAVARGNALYHLQLAFFVRGEDEKDLANKTNAVDALCRSNSLHPIREVDDLCPLDSYLRNLPMAYEPQFDHKTLHRSRLVFSQHIANLAPLYGRSTGTGNPGLLFFNRGGEPLTFDPLNLYDRKKNGHALIVGPTGSGKSATLVYMILQMLALYRPRIFLIESGNSFGLLGEYLKHKDLSVNALRLTPNTDVSLPPFADAVKLLGVAKLDLELNADRDLNDDPSDDYDSPDDEDEDGERDILGEMEIAARIMITGGEAREERRMTRSDRLMIRRAIVNAAKTVKAQGRDQVLTADVEQAMRQLERNTQRGNDRAEEMADALGLFCSPGSFENQLFNRPGKAWPECDVTILDLGLLAREGYQDKLTVAYIGLMNTINNRVERWQHDGRPTLVITDEGHVITTNPLLAPYVIKITKMWRKLGAWFWIATQNLDDFPDASRRMLTMLEWWICLVMPKDEIEQIARFRQLSEEQTALLLAARKSPGQYTEGVVLTDHLTALFRNVPPAIALALGMTEKEEKAQRAQLMKQYGCTELEAVFKVAEQISIRRGQS